MVAVSMLATVQWEAQAVPSHMRARTLTGVTMPAGTLRLAATAFTMAPLEVAQRRRYRSAHLVIRLGQLSVNANTQAPPP
ncbi:MAG TPA: hypothetical protein VIY90_00115 [Steroidobacteraceae bacterium]